MQPYEAHARERKQRENPIVDNDVIVMETTGTVCGACGGRKWAEREREREREKRERNGHLGEGVAAVDGLGGGVALLHELAVGGDDAVAQGAAQLRLVDVEQLRHRGQRRLLRRTHPVALRFELGVALHPAKNAKKNDNRQTTADQSTATTTANDVWVGSIQEKTTVKLVKMMKKQSILALGTDLASRKLGKTR